MINIISNEEFEDIIKDVLNEFCNIVNNNPDVLFENDIEDN